MLDKGGQHRLPSCPLMDVAGDRYRSHFACYGVDLEVTGLIDSSRRGGIDHSLIDRSFDSALCWLFSFHYEVQFCLFICKKEKSELRR